MSRICKISSKDKKKAQRRNGTGAQRRNIAKKEAKRSLQLRLI